MQRGLGSSMVATHYRNFDALRLFAAGTVVFSHSFLIATGSEATEPLAGTGRVTGIYGVFIFFILSGFLVTESAKRTATLPDFMLKRFLRIAPALVVSTLVVAYLVCPPFAADGPLAFVTDGSVLNLVMQIVSLHSVGFYFANVTFYPKLNEADWLPSVANGVLWTIRIEVIGYVLIGLMAAASLFKARLQPVMIAIVIGLIVATMAYAYSVKTKWISELLLVLPSLCCGILMNWLVQGHRPSGWIALASLTGLVPAAYFGVLPQAFCFLVAYPLIWFGGAAFNPMPRFYEGTDISYGVYLYGWPITQLIRHFVGPDLNGYEMTALTLPATMAAAWLSWRFIEKPALRFKPARRQDASPQSLRA